MTTMTAMKTMLRQLIPVVVVLAVPIIPLLFMGDLMKQWVSGLENSQYLPWIVIALLSGDLILPIPSSVVTTYIGGQSKTTDLIRPAGNLTIECIKQHAEKNQHPCPL